MNQETEIRYENDFAQIVQIIEQNRSQAIQVINHASVLTAWQVGAYISDKIKNAAWGTKVVQQLAEYIHTQNPTLKGWSRMNIYRMVKFYETYSSIEFIERASSLKLLPKSSDEFVPTPSAQIVSTPLIQMEQGKIVSTPLIQMEQGKIVSTPLTQIPKFLLRTTWSNHQAILHKCEHVDQQIFVIRGKQVMVDRDLAALYGVETRVLKQAVKRNPERFPEEFMFQLDNQEFEKWRSQIVMSNSDKMGLRYPPYVFTEQGVAMLSAVAFFATTASDGKIYQVA